MKEIFDLVERVINTMKNNGLFIVLSIVFPVVLYYFGAGSEIIKDLFTEEHNFSNFFVACSFIFLAVSIWCVPTASIYLFIWLTRTLKNIKIEILDNLLDVYNAKSKKHGISKSLEIQIRYVALLPWFIFICTLAKVARGSVFMSYIIFVIILLIFFTNLIVNRVKIKIKKLSLNAKKYWEIKSIGIIIALLSVIFWFLSYNWFPAFYPQMILYANLLGALLLYTLFIVKETSENFPTTAPGGKLITLMILKKTLIVHLAALCISILCVIIFYFLQRSFAINTISVITVSTMLMSFYILMIEFLCTSQILIVRIVNEVLGLENFRYTLYRFVIGGFALFTVGSVFKSCNPHTFRQEPIDKLVTSNKKQYDKLFTRDSIYDYFTKWYKQRDKKSNEPVDVYLVSGQGGGSRAGLWFLLNMRALDSINPNFYNNLFSISTVSGSSSGAQMFLASKECLEPENQINSCDFAASIYRKNYLSSALYGLLFGDFIDYLTGKEDRNFYFQNEEVNAFTDALKEQKIKYDTTRVSKFFNTDYLLNYRIANNKMPLFFINSTVVENGKKVVFSPIQLQTRILKNNSLNEPIFSFYEDAYGIYRSCEWSRNKGLPLSACVNASQSFPLINSYSYLHGVGRLADGGLFENSGTSTTTDLYLALKRIAKDRKMNVSFTIITILNGQLDNREANNFKKASILNTITAVANNPFTGHQLMAYKKLNNTKSLLDPLEQDKNIIIQLSKEYHLTRLLSRETTNGITADFKKNITEHPNVYDFEKNK